jgi:uncharacterized protein (TIGR02246 family)
MRTRLIAFIAGIVAITGLLPCAATAAPADEAKLRALEDAFAAAVRGHDLDAIMKVYAPDVLVFDVSPPRQYVGAAAYREDWKGFLSAFTGPVKFEVTDLVVSADGALGYGHSIQHVVAKDTKGKVNDLTVRVTDVYRKISGTWLIVHEHVSVPVDLDTGKPDLTSKP